MQRMITIRESIDTLRQLEELEHLDWKSLREEAETRIRRMMILLKLMNKEEERLKLEEDEWGTNPFGIM